MLDYSTAIKKHVHKKQVHLFTKTKRLRLFHHLSPNWYARNPTRSKQYGINTEPISKNQDIKCVTLVGEVNNYCS